MDFVAIDFETAHAERHNPCEIGITVVKNLEVVERLSWFIKPPCFPAFSPYCMDIHKITPADVQNSPAFDVLWPQVEAYFKNNLVVAHNVAFDSDVLEKTLDHYNITDQGPTWFCSLEFARIIFPFFKEHSLASLCHMFGIEYSGHRAGSDSFATATLTIRMLRGVGVSNHAEFKSFTDSPHSFVDSQKQQKKPANDSSKSQRVWRIDDSTEYTRLKYTGVTPDPNSMFYQKNIVFTQLSLGQERNYSEFLGYIGSNMQNGLTKKTDFLVIADKHYDDLSNEKLQTGKMKKAIEYISRGVPIKIISESDFLSEIPHEITEA